ncbi:MAG: ABC transporter permease [Gemmatimonadaceae bacterium]
MLQNLTSDLRFAGRLLRKNPVFTAVAVIVIALGTGAVTTIYSAMNAIALRQLPATTDGSRLVGLRRTEANGRAGISASEQFVAHLRDRSRTLNDVAAWSRMSLALATGGGGEAHALNGNIVSGNFFSVLGVRPALGRFFLPEEDSIPLMHPVVVVSHAFWSSALGGDSAAVGRAATVNGHPYRIIGVAPPGFRGVFTPLKIDAWVPLMMHAQVRPTRGATEHTPWLWAFGRLADGVDHEAARRELHLLTAAYSAASGEPARYAANTSVSVAPLTGLPEDARSDFLGFMAVLLGAATLVLLIASVNVASMLSARAVARRGEMALRTALGAARGRLVRQLLTESVALFVMGAVGGVVVAWLATSAFERVYIPSSDGLSLELTPDPSVLAFALIVALATGIVFGLAPALQGAEKNITLRLRSESAAGGARRSFFGNALIVGQLALSLVLLVTAGLFMRALSYGARVDPGFERAGVLVMSFNSESWGYDSTRARAFYGAVRDRVAALPGVTAAAYSERVPLTLSNSADRVEIGAGDGTIDTVQIAFAKVTAGFFDVLRIPLLRGRAIAATDVASAPMVAVVNERFAQRYWPDGSAVGRTFGYRGRTATVVGIARDAKYASLTEPAAPFAYFSMDQMWQHRHSLLVLGTADPRQLAHGIQDAVREIDPALPRPAISTMLDETSIALFPQRVAAIVTAVLGGVGLLLATVGLYGIIAYSTSRRSKEIGIRMAIGARRADVLGMIVREGMRLAGTGVVIGLVLAAGATRLMMKFLFGVSPMDAVTFAGMSALFIGVALLASYLPARRAAAADPMSVLRSD